jgi:hypothetical protein
MAGKEPGNCEFPERSFGATWKIHLVTYPGSLSKGMKISTPYPNEATHLSPGRQEAGLHRRQEVGKHKTHWIPTYAGMRLSSPFIQRKYSEN